MWHFAYVSPVTFSFAPTGFCTDLHILSSWTHGSRLKNVCTNVMR